MNRLQQSYFELFGLPCRYRIEQEQLHRHYCELQRTLHPDRFSGDPSFSKRLTAQYAAYVNEGYQTLKSPTTRALYLLELAGHRVDPDASVTLSTEFLTEQMRLREEMADMMDHSSPREEYERILGEVQSLMANTSKQFEVVWEQQDDRNLEQAGQLAVRMQFLSKLITELGQQGLLLQED